METDWFFRHSQLEGICCRCQDNRGRDFIIHTFIEGEELSDCGYFDFCDSCINYLLEHEYLQDIADYDINGDSDKVVINYLLKNLHPYRLLKDFYITETVAVSVAEKIKYKDYYTD